MEETGNGKASIFTKCERGVTASTRTTRTSSSRTLLSGRTPTMESIRLLRESRGAADVEERTVPDADHNLLVTKRSKLAVLQVLTIGEEHRQQVIAVNLDRSR